MSSMLDLGVPETMSNFFVTRGFKGRYNYVYLTRIINSSINRLRLESYGRVNKLSCFT